MLESLLLTNTSHFKNTSDGLLYIKLSCGKTIAKNVKEKKDRNVLLKTEFGYFSLGETGK